MCGRCSCVIRYPALSFARPRRQAAAAGPKPLRDGARRKMQQFVWRPDAGAAARVNRFRYFLLYVVRVIGKKTFVARRRMSAFSSRSCRFLHRDGGGVAGEAGRDAMMTIDAAGFRRCTDAGRVCVARARRGGWGAASGRLRGSRDVGMLDRRSGRRCVFAHRAPASRRCRATRPGAGRDAGLASRVGSASRTTGENDAAGAARVRCRAPHPRTPGLSARRHALRAACRLSCGARRARARAHATHRRATSRRTRQCHGRRLCATAISAPRRDAAAAYSSASAMSISTGS
ncbi:hypothetical protein X897_5483 [Burkholderia pseudomallei ABCPW 30]|nr:hypothetical protein X897_5483 [Burkholderia pseudomallei ABCPW 30]